MKQIPSSRIRKWVVIYVVAGIMVLSGCATKVTVEKNKLNTGPGNMADNSGLPKTVYAVSFEALDTIIRVKKFGVQEQADGLVAVTHGLAYDIDNSFLYLSGIGEMRIILRRHGIESVQGLKEYWESSDPVFPGSRFRPVPKALGVKLFNYAIQNNPDRFDNDHFERDRFLRGW